MTKLNYAICWLAITAVIGGMLFLVITHPVH